jgi:hypothetical protein
LYPSELNSAPYDASTNRVALGPGDQIPVPAGTWYIGLGFYLVLQFLDPITGVWVNTSSASYSRGLYYVKSDGFNFRVANLTGCPTGAVIYALGSNYVQATTTVAVTGGGGSLWQPIVGGGLGFSSVVTANAGAGYGVPPIVLIPPPPPGPNNPNGVGGVAASGYCGISSGTVSGFTFTNTGAGYATAPTPIVLPNPTDPNINVGITAATLAFSLVTGGGLTACLCTNNGAPLSNPNSFTLTVSGAGTGASLTGFAMQVVTAASVTTGAGLRHGGGVAHHRWRCSADRLHRQSRTEGHRMAAATGADWYRRDRRRLGGSAGWHDLRWRLVQHQRRTVLCTGWAARLGRDRLGQRPWARFDHGQRGRHRDIATGAVNG